MTVINLDEVRAKAREAEALRAFAGDLYEVVSPLDGKHVDHVDTDRFAILSGTLPAYALTRRAAESLIAQLTKALREEP